jgi:hypothetical protein
MLPHRRSLTFPHKGRLWHAYEGITELRKVEVRTDT